MWMEFYVVGPPQDILESTKFFFFTFRETHFEKEVFIDRRVRIWFLLRHFRMGYA